MNIKKQGLAASLSLTLAFGAAAGDLSAANMQQSALLHDYGLVITPNCTDERGRKVKFIGAPTQELRRKGFGLAYTYREAGRPVVKYDQDRLPNTPPEFQNHVLVHECAHNALNHFNRPMTEEQEELEADCYALDRMGYGRREVEIMIDTMDALYPYDPDAMINVTVPDMRPNLERCLMK